VAVTELLASLADFAAVRGVTYDPTDEQAIIALEGASEMVRTYCRQSFALVEDDEIFLGGSRTGSVLLPEFPVIEVSEVGIALLDEDEVVLDAADYRVTKAGILEIAPTLSSNWFTGPTWFPWVWPPSMRAVVRVVYTHGYAEIPADVSGVVMNVANRKLRQQASGGSIVASEGIGTYQVAYATSVGVDVLSDDDRATLAGYRRLAAA
jgi:hypothetical protein